MQTRISPSLVISVIALVVALGGVSYAAIKIPKNSVGSKQLKKNAVTAKKLKNGSVVASKLKGGAVNAGKLQNGAVGSAKLQDGAVNSAKVADGTLLGSDFKAGELPSGPAGEAWYSARESLELLVVGDSFADVVTTQTLPAGSYVLSGRANVLGDATTNSTLICSMANDAAQNFTVGKGGVLPLSMSATAELSEPGTVSLSCLKSAGAPRIAQAHVIATSVSKVNTAE